ncbi:nuclear pore complex protein Nup85 [Anthonomus grandis grandis]|uniref:nuclear pore complex protein Nup85 n=1 Tax=Anthonomus grandis grandis TaxID=2921223 RepID=UPI0021654704|nr:nuclear pore complex protein Nup85 [Anthonomus grandis grandis]
MANEEKTFLVPNDICRRAGLGVSWRPMNEITVFPYQLRTFRQKDAPSPFASDKPSSIFNIRRDVILFHAILRKLVNESNGTFLGFQAFISTKPTDLKPEIVKVSRQYRSIIRACLENLQDEVTKTHITAKEREELHSYITIFYSIECIWHICEILFIDMMPGNVVLPRLLDWVRFHFPKHERNAATLISGDTEGIELDETYWPTIFGNLLQGRIKIVRALLKQHSAANSSVFQMVLQLLKSMPTFNVINNVSLSEFNLQWRHWTMDVQMKIDAKQFISNRNLDLLTRLMVGEEEAWTEMIPKCEAWYEFLAGYLFYTEPMVKTFELGQYAKQSIAKMRMKHHLKHLDRVLLAAMEFDIFEVVKEIQEMTENGWFVTHLTDLLYHAGKLSLLEKDVEGFSAENLRESFLLDYGTTLMGHKSLWQVGLSYLDNCPNDGLPAIELLLPRIPFDSEAKVHKLVREAKNRNLNHVAQSICKIQGLRSLRRGRLGNALTWALKSHDGPFTSYLADKYLQEYINSGDLNNTDLLDNLGSCMLASDRLIFLGKYHEFRKLYQAGEYKECGYLLVSLLASKIVPKYFWSVLLSEAIPLLESEELVFSSNDTYQILHCLEEKESIPELSDQLAIIRLATARNLSRALMFEAQLTN